MGVTDATTTEALLRETRWLERLARGLVGDPDRAADVAQETLARALARPPRVDRERLRPWLATVARNLVRSSARRSRTGNIAERLAARLEAVDSTADVVARAEIQREAVDAVLSLDEPYRTAVLLRYLHDLPPREVARQTDVAVETARTRIKRGIDQVRRRLDERRGGRRAWLAVLAAPSFRTAPLPLAWIALMGTNAKLAVVAAVVLTAVLVFFGTRAPLATPVPPAVVSVPDAQRGSAGGEDAAPDLATDRTAVATGAAEPTAPLTGARRLRGVVVAEESDVPLSDCTVVARAVADRIAGDAVELAQAKTGADGEFALAFDPPDDARIEVEVRAPERALVREAIRRPGEDPEVASEREDLGRVSVPPGTRIRGRVVDAGGVRPVAGATLVVAPDWVWLANHSPTTLLREAFVAGRTDAAGRFELDRPVIASQWKPPLLVAVADAGIGWLELPALRRSAHRIEVADIQLAPAFDLEVHVRDAGGRPAGDVAVRAEPRFQPIGAPGDWSHALGPLAGRFRARTDATGFARIAGLPAGERGYRVVVRDGGGRVVRTELAPAQAGRTAELVVALPAAATLRIHGVVSDAAGSSIEGAIVGSGAERAASDARGRFAIDVPRGSDPVSVWARADGFARIGTHVDAGAGAPDVGWNATLRPGGELRGVVVDEDGGPLGGARVRAGSGSARTDVGGWFAIPDLPLEPQRLTVTVAGAIVDHEPAAATPGTAPLTIRVRRVPDVLVHMVARVMDESGRPVEVVEASVVQRVGGQDASREAVERRIGSVEAMISQAGRWRLTASGRTGTEGVVEFDVQPGMTEVTPTVVIHAGISLPCEVVFDGPATSRPDALHVVVGERGQSVRFSGEGHEVRTRSIVLDLRRGTTFSLEGVDPERPVELLVDDERFTGELRFEPTRLAGTARLHVSVPATVVWRGDAAWPDDELTVRFRREGETDWRPEVRFGGLAGRTELMRWPLVPGRWEWRIEAPEGVSPSEGALDVSPGGRATIRLTPPRR